MNLIAAQEIPVMWLLRRRNTKHRQTDDRSTIAQQLLSVNFQVLPGFKTEAWSSLLDYGLLNNLS